MYSLPGGQIIEARLLYIGLLKISDAGCLSRLPLYREERDELSNGNMASFARCSSQMVLTQMR
jgi:hypothetical protein